jgi:hypothetical protein
MKHDHYDEKFMRLARAVNRQELLRRGRQCLVCRYWKKPCSACAEPAKAAPGKTAGSDVRTPGPVTQLGLGKVA